MLLEHRLLREKEYRSRALSGPMSTIPIPTMLSYGFSSLSQFGFLEAPWKYISHPLRVDGHDLFNWEVGGQWRIIWDRASSQKIGEGLILH